MALYLVAWVIHDVARGTPLDARWARAARRVFAILVVVGAIVWVARFFGAFGGPVPV